MCSLTFYLDKSQIRLYPQSWKTRYSIFSEDRFKINFKVNVDDLGEVAMEQGIQCMPTFIFYKNGQQLDRVEGASEDAVRQFIAKHK